jgi:PLP dependent protein
MINDLARSIQRVGDRIARACGRAGRKTDDILLVAVTKTVEADRIQQAIQEGLSCFGENYLQEARGKIEKIHQGTWHFIGHLQTNKAKEAVRLFSMIETLDSPKLARELNRQALAAGKVIEVLIEVNEAGESSKSGLSPDQVPALLKESSSWLGLRLRGLMSLPPYHPDPEKSRPWYRSLRQWKEKWQGQFPGIDFSHLSMGMSNDFEIAIEEGSTMIRVGTALFGVRP